MCAISSQDYASDASCSIHTRVLNVDPHFSLNPFCVRHHKNLALNVGSVVYVHENEYIELVGALCRAWRLFRRFLHFFFSEVSSKRVQQCAPSDEHRVLNITLARCWQTGTQSSETHA